ncbi:MAG: addiction module protein [Aquabacterium sp.]|nr:addiction module protein [Aquabacterium sp.]
MPATPPDSLADLVQRGRGLPPEERERLVDQLLLSLNEPVAAALDAAWPAEIARRLAAHDQGLEPARDAATVFAEADRLAR